MSQYHPLTEKEAVDYAAALPGFSDSGKQLACREIGDGNLNLVFHIQEIASGKSLIMKQALPYAKVVGESWPLTLDRARIESEALAIHHRLCPGLAPQIYKYDADLALTVMEDLSDHVILRRGLIEGNKYPLFAGHIGHFLAHTLFCTSDFGMNQQEKKLQMGRFINPELCKITEELIFDHPYTDADTNNFDPNIRREVEAIWADRELHLQAALLREKFLTQAQALLHGDLHTGSIFVTEDSTKVIDPEFAYYGPMGFDIGAVIANLLLNYAGREGWSKDAAARADYRGYLLGTVHDVWSRFVEEFGRLWEEHGADRMFRTTGFREAFMGRLLKETVGFAGCKMIRRIIGLAHVADIDRIEDMAVKAQAERIALTIGTNLVKRHQWIESIDEVLDMAKEAVR
jgi:5-methylthioribose kinase